MKQFEVPDKLLHDFINFLDIAQDRFTDAEIESAFSENEKKVIKMVRKWIKKHEQPLMAGERVALTRNMYTYEDSKGEMK
jgi:hypothetical protein